jgi:hypothetical protein
MLNELRDGFGIRIMFVGVAMGFLLSGEVKYRAIGLRPHGIGKQIQERQRGFLTRGPVIVGSKKLLGNGRRD